jgi:type 1 glutamine amidotransferase
MAGSPQPFDLSTKWIETIRKAAPAKPAVAPRRRRRALLYSVSLGYRHWVIPHTSAMLRVLAETSRAFELVETADPESFVPDMLAEFDAVILNNTCPTEPGRDSFFDVLQDQGTSETLKGNIMRFVEQGGGLVSIHGGIIAFNNCPRWDEMQGGSFDRHPRQQQVTLTAVEPPHPLARAFGGEPFVHVDEPYLFKGSYSRRSFRPLLAMNTATLVMSDGEPTPPHPCYAAWVKRHGNGRVFYCSPSHNAQSFEDPRLMRFVLDGIQYALGDLECDDTPLG